MITKIKRVQILFLLFSVTFFSGCYQAPVETIVPEESADEESLKKMLSLASLPVIVWI